MVKWGLDFGLGLVHGHFFAACEERLFRVMIIGGCRAIHSLNAHSMIVILLFAYSMT
jgi:hypothetical protein